MKMANRLILREVNKAYEIPARCLCEKAGFEILTLLERDETPIQSKKAWLKQGIEANLRMLPKLGRIRRADQLVLIGNYMSLFTVMLNKCHVIHPRELYWWGFQIRRESMQKLLRNAFRILYSDNLRFIIFSQYEKELYAKSMGLREDCFRSIAYGDWQNMQIEPAAEIKKVTDALTATGDSESATGNQGSAAESHAAGALTEANAAGAYYFTGGYSNRDYAGLLQAWEGIERRLVIIGSKNNADLWEYAQHPTNPYVEVLLDTPPDVFAEKLAGAKACILPFISNTGAAGQTVALRCMKMGKLIISSAIDAMAEYIEDGRTGFLIRDLKRELPGIIARIESDPDLEQRMIAAQTELFRRRFSYEVITKELTSLFA